MKAYSADLRQKIYDAYTHGEGSIRQLAQRFKVSPSFIQRLLKRYKDDATLEPRPHGGGFAPKLEPHLELVQTLVKQHPDATLAQLCEMLDTQTGVRVSIGALSRLLKKLGLPRQHKSSRAINRPGF